jgi:hypothetical protein
MGIGDKHEKNTVCIGDFLWDKTGIDVCMRAAFICDQCKAQSDDSPQLSSEQFAEIASILNAISFASRRGTDILLESTSGLTRSDSGAIRFDVFLCHNSQDKPAVRQLNQILGNAGIKAWFDEEQIKPGEVWQDKLEATIPAIGACLVIVGDSGFGPWQDMERRAFIAEFAARGCKVIPVLIGSPTNPPTLPLFLKQFMWSDLRSSDPREIARVIAALRS